MKHFEIKKQLEAFRAMEPGQLKDELSKLKKEQFNLRFQQATGQLEKTSRMGEVRDQIARVKTVLKQKTPPQTV